MGWVFVETERIGAEGPVPWGPLREKERTSPGAWLFRAKEGGEIAARWRKAVVFSGCSKGGWLAGLDYVHSGKRDPPLSRRLALQRCGMISAV